MLAVQNLSLSRPSLFEPEVRLPNKWFVDAGTLQPNEARAFQRVSGIDARLISPVDEAEMARRAVSDVRRDLGLNMKSCVGLVVASSSMSYETSTDPTATIDLADPKEALFARWPSVTPLAYNLRDEFGLTAPDDMVHGINWGCSAYTKALEICLEMGLRRNLKPGEFFLVVTTNHLSSRMDYADRISAVFGDCATATVVRRSEDVDPRNALHILAAHASMFPIATVPFVCTEKPLRKLPDERSVTAEGAGGVFVQMDGQAVKDQAPTVLSTQARLGLEELTLPANAVGNWLPHQAGRAITQCFLGHLASAQIGGTATHDIAQVGNLSSSSIPWQLYYKWFSLGGIVGCPSVGASIPGRKEMSQGRAYLRRDEA